MAQPTPTEQRALFAQGFKKRMGNLAGVGDRIATDVPKIASGLVKEEIFGLPGLVGDLIVPAMSAKGPLALDPAAQQATEKFQEEYGASGLAQKAGVELSDEFLDAEGNLRPEMLGRLLAPGALYAKTAGLAGLFARAAKTKTRGSGIEKKGTGTAQLDSSPSDLEPVTSTPEVLEGEVVGGKSDKYTKLQKQADEARTSELSDAKTLQMEIQGVTDAFDVAAAKKLDATFEMIGRQMGEDAPYTSKDFTDNVIDEFEGAVDQGMSRADALIDAVRVTTDNYNRTFNADLFNTEDILSDLSKGINEDFGFDAALDARRAGQANRAALEQQLKKAESVTRRADAAASQAELERLAGVTDDMTPDEAFQAISSYVGKDQAGISGAGIPEPKRPQLRVISDNTPVKKAAGGKVDLRSGIGNVFKLYS